MSAGALIKFFICEEGRSFEGSVHLGPGALSNNYGMFYNYLQESAIKISIRFLLKTHNDLKMTDMIVYIKCGLLLKRINYRFLQPFLLEEYKSKILFIPSAITSKRNYQYFSLSQKMSSVFTKLLQCTCSIS